MIEDLFLLLAFTAVFGLTVCFAAALVFLVRVLVHLINEVLDSYFPGRRIRWFD